MGYEIDFIPVGEGTRSGDAICLRYGDLNGPRTNQFVVVIDGGTVESGSKLVDHLRTHYQTDVVDLVVSTHPDGDHTSGLRTVLTEMTVGEVWMHLPWEHTDEIARMFKDGRVTDNSVRESLRKSLSVAHEVQEIATKRAIRITEPFTGTSDATGRLVVCGPSLDYYESLLPEFRGTPEPASEAEMLIAKAFEILKEAAKMVVEERWDLETLGDDGRTSAENNTSTILCLQGEDDRLSLLTGDAGIPALTHAVGRLESHFGDLPSRLKFVQVPHHGSKRNISPALLDRIVGPKLPATQRGVKRTAALVSVATNGAPKHPARKVVNAFTRRGTTVNATQGISKRHSYQAPAREGWTAATPLPFFDEVEE